MHSCKKPGSLGPREHLTAAREPLTAARRSLAAVRCSLAAVRFSLAPRLPGLLHSVNKSQNKCTVGKKYFFCTVFLPCIIFKNYIQWHSLSLQVQYRNFVLLYMFIDLHPPPLPPLKISLQGKQIRVKYLLEVLLNIQLLLVHLTCFRMALIFPDQPVSETKEEQEEQNLFQDIVICTMQQSKYPYIYTRGFLVTIASILDIP